MSLKLNKLLKRYGVPLCILALSLSITVLGWQVALHEERNEAQQDFIHMAQQYRKYLVQRMEDDIHFLADLSGLFASSDTVPYKAFERYISHVYAMTGAKRIHHLGYLPRITTQNISSHEAFMRAEGFPDYRIKATGSSNEYLPFAYLYPFDTGAKQNLLGVDAFKEPIRREAWQKARDLNQVIATRKLNTILVPSDQPSFLLFAPVYRIELPTSTKAERQQALKGFTYAAFRANDLLQSAWGPEFARQQDVRFTIGDEDKPIYQSSSLCQQTPRSAPCFEYTTTIQAAGQRWRLTLRSPSSFYQTPIDNLPTAILLSGIMISLLLTAVSVLLNDKRRAKKRQQEQSQRFRCLFDQNPDAVYSFDLNGNFTAVNAQAEKLTGIPASTLLTMSFSPLIAADKLTESSQRLQLAMKGTPSYGETALINTAGERIELGVTHLPIIVNNTITGVFGIAKDITSRKRAEDALQQAHDELESRVQERTAALQQEVEARKQAEAVLRELAHHLENVREDERTRIAREIHDELGGALAAIKFGLSVPVRHDDRDYDGAQKRNEETLKLVDEAVVSLRRIMADLRPSVLDDLGLWATLEWLSQEFEERMGIHTKFQLKGEELQIEPNQATAIFRIVQESLNNVAKHAQAQKVEILANTTNHSIQIDVKDNGRGFSRETVTRLKTYGLLGMRERVKAFNGKINIDSRPGEGATVSIVFPVNG